MEATIELEVEYADNIATGTRNYSEIRDDDVCTRSGDRNVDILRIF